MTLGAWLEDIGVPEAEAALRTSGFERVEDLLAARLTEDDLREAGLNMKTRKRVWHALAAATSSGQEQQAVDAPQPAGHGRETKAPLSRFAVELWDSFATVHADVKAQTNVCATLSRYIQGRLQLDHDYYRRLLSLNELLPPPSNESVLLRSYGPIFEVLTTSATVTAELHAARIAEMTQGGLANLSTLAQQHAAELERLSSEAARLRLHLKQAYANLERDQTQYIRRQHDAMASSRTSSVNSNASQMAQAALAQASAQAEVTYRRTLRVANRVQRDMYSDGGAMASIMAQLERMALAVPNAVCHRAQQLVAIDGADSNVTKQITDICAAATRADVEEYIVRNSSGRPRPSDIPVVGAEPSLLDDHRVALVSIQPVRIWEVDLHLRQVTIRTAREEVTLQGSTIREISRTPRRPCEAQFFVDGLNVSKAQLLPDLVHARNGDTSSGALSICFSLPACRDMFVMAIRGILESSDADEHTHGNINMVVDDTTSSSVSNAAGLESGSSVDDHVKLAADGIASSGNSSGPLSRKTKFWVGHIPSTDNSSTGQSVASVICSAVSRSDDYGLYVIGVSFRPTAVASGSDSVTDMLAACVGTHLGDGYELLAFSALPFLLLVAFVRKDLRHFFGMIQSCAASLLKTRQATGGVALTMSFLDSPQAFVCMHLPPDPLGPEDSRSAQRAFDSAKTRCSRLSSLMHELQKQVQLWDSGNGILSFSSQYHTVLLGELNFNLDGSLSAPVQAYAKQGDWQHLCKCDQLLKQQRAGRLLLGFSEGALAWPPSDIEGVLLPTRWRARILHHSNLPGSGCELLLYGTSIGGKDAAVGAHNDAVHAVYSVAASWVTLPLPLAFLPTTATGCTIAVTGLSAAGLVPVQQSSRAVLRLLSDQSASTADSFVNFAAPFLDARSASARTSTRVKSIEPTWDRERVLLRASLPLSQAIPSGIGLQLVVRVWQDSMLGDNLIGEGVVSLLPAVGGQVAVPFCVQLCRGGALSGSLSGEVVVLRDAESSSSSNSDSGSEGDDTDESDIDGD